MKSNEEDLHSVSALVAKANRRSIIREASQNRTKVVPVPLTPEEHKLVKEVAGLSEQSMRGLCRSLILAHVIQYKEKALDDYEQQTRTRARRGVRPEAPIVPSDRY